LPCVGERGPTPHQPPVNPSEPERETRVALQFMISFVGVIVFTGLAAYDAQRLKAMALAMPAGQTGSYAIVGALALYLDFINLFLFLLRFLGNRRD